MNKGKWRECDVASFAEAYNKNYSPTECVGFIIIIHMKPKALIDRELAEQWDAPNKLIIEPNEEITL